MLRPLLPVLLTFAAAVPGWGQDVSLVSRTDPVRERPSAEAPNPFEEPGTLGGDVGFQSAGAREATPIPGGRRRLAYTLSRGAEAVDLDRFLEARPTFRDRWLIDELRVRFDGLDRPEIVDEAHRRARGDMQSTVVTRRLEVRGEADAVMRAEQFLDAVVRQNQKMVSAEAWVLRVEPAPDGAIDGEARVALVDARAFERRVTAAREGRADVLASPKVLVLGGQSVTVATVQQVAYLADFDFQKVGDDVLADPVVGTVHEGFRIGLTPILGPEGTTISIGAELLVSDLKRPLEEFEVTLPRPHTTLRGTPTVSEDRKSVTVKADGPKGSVPVAVSGATATIQLPETSTTRWSSEAIRLGDGDAGFHVTGLRGSRWNEAGERLPYGLELLVRVSVQDPEALVAAAEPLGEVLGYDAAAKKAFVELREGVDAEKWSGRAVRIVRGTDDVGGGHLVTRSGAIAVVTVEEGAPREGDLVVP